MRGRQQIDRSEHITRDDDDEHARDNWRYQRHPHHSAGGGNLSTRDPEASKLLLDQGPAIEAACASKVSAGSMTKVQKPTRELCEGAIKETSQSKSVIDRTLVECRNRTT